MNLNCAFVLSVSPRKGRWIEITIFGMQGGNLLFLPVRGDGLKLEAHRGQPAYTVSPRKGRWIEI